jgi:hypothetical protein
MQRLWSVAAGGRIHGVVHIAVARARATSPPAADIEALQTSPETVGVP